ncbi:ABC transporter substrate-binding protein [Limnochorda pilosa]|uniref:Sugar ABC transporter substrate-binding protein n=1 Tax=Limnochorda pilosa TaxID=1555112 RepID=A0A0K2SL85_LIMPI|nr:sugar ABC transporter substrate-binding protein [Limnochorda pilosa]BAS27878.1 sugar ABC transporter substrate-binding protein [Limnochorda pilosa]
MRRACLVAWVLALTLAATLAAPAFAAEPITFWKFADTYGDPTIQEYVDQWNAAHSPKVEFVSIPWAEYTTTRLTAAFASGQGPDVFWVSPGDFLRYVSNGILEPMDTYLTASQVEDLVPVARDKATVNGRIYGVPVELEPLAVFYDKDLFEEKGLAVPQSWDELVRVAQALTTPERFGLVIEPAADFYQLFTFYPFLWSAGGDVMDEGWTQARIASPESVAALQFWSDLVNVHGVSPKSQPAAANDVTMLGSGFGAMQVTGMWAVKILKEQYPDFNYGVFPVPPKERGGESVSVTGGWMQVINAKSKDVEGAAEFTRWLFYESDFPVVWTIQKNSKFPTLQSILDANREYFHSGPMKVFTEEILPAARPEPRFPPEVQRALLDALQGTMFGGVPAEMAAKTAEAQINRFLRTYTGAR